MPPRSPAQKPSRGAITLAGLTLLLTLLGESARGVERLASRTQTGRRLVSLAPSNTELLYAIGAAGSIAAVSSVCYQPAGAKQKPKAGSFIAARFEKLASVKPDAVLLVSGQEMLASQIKHHNYKTIILPNKKLDDIPANLRRLGAICGNEKRAEELAEKLVHAKRNLTELLARREMPRVLYCVWPNPVITVGAGSFLNDVITTCGGINVAGRFDTSYPKLSPERIIVVRPDVLILPFEARPSQQAMQSSHNSLLRRAPWSSLPAVKNGRVFYLPDDDHNFLARPTLTIVRGMHWITVRLHPEIKPQVDAWLESSLAALGLK